MTTYQPQVESWVGYSSITFKAAVSFTPEGRDEPVFGGLRAPRGIGPWSYPAD